MAVAPMRQWSRERDGPMYALQPQRRAPLIEVVVRRAAQVTSGEALEGAAVLRAVQLPRAVEGLQDPLREALPEFREEPAGLQLNRSDR